MPRRASSVRKRSLEAASTQSLSTLVSALATASCIELACTRRWRLLPLWGLGFGYPPPPGDREGDVAKPPRSPSVSRPSTGPARRGARPVEGFGQEVVHARFAAGPAVLVEGVGGERHDGGGDALRRDAAGGGQAVHARHAHVHQDQVEGRRGPPARLLAPGRAVYLQPSRARRARARSALTGLSSASSTRARRRRQGRRARPPRGRRRRRRPGRRGSHATDARRSGLIR